MKIAIICSNTAERKWKFWTYLQLQDGGRGILLATTTTFVRSYFCLRSLFYYSEKLCWLGKIWAVDVSFDEVVKSEPWVRLVWRTIYLKASVKKKKKNAIAQRRRSWWCDLAREMQTSLFRRLAPSLAARFQRNQNIISSFSSSSSSSVLHHATSSPSSPDVEPVHITENCVRVCSFFSQLLFNCNLFFHSILEQIHFKILIRF